MKVGGGDGLVAILHVERVLVGCMQMVDWVGGEMG